MLYAFSATPVNGTLSLLYSGAAGQWPNLGGNANVVPMVANGLAYVAAYKTLTIFGPNGTALVANAVVAPQDKLPAGVTRITGMLLAVHSSQLTLLTRSSVQLEVDARPAVDAQRSTKLVVGEPYTVLAPAVSSGATLQATSIMRAKPGQGAWPADR